MSQPTPVRTRGVIRPGRGTPWGRVVLVELRKLVDTRSSRWLLAGTAVLLVVVTGVTTVLGVRGDLRLGHPTYLTAAASTGGVLVLLLAVTSAAGEWSQRVALVTFALEPRRERVVLAKVAAVTVLALAAAVVANLAAATGTVLASLLGAPVRGEVPWWAVLQLGLGLLLAAYVGLAAGLLLLNTPAAIAALLAAAWIVPVTLTSAATTVGWVAALVPWVTPVPAVGALAAGPMSTSDWQHLAAVGLVWIAAPLAAGTLRILRSDAP